MAAKIIMFEQQARDKILKGVNIMADAVKSTLGPRGRNAILEKSWGAPNVTKDGVTVAKEIELEDKFENLGAQMLKEVASKTSDVAGDGTTTATVLAQAICREGMQDWWLPGLQSDGASSGESGQRPWPPWWSQARRKLSKPTKDKTEIATGGNRVGQRRSHHGGQDHLPRPWRKSARRA